MPTPTPEVDVTPHSGDLYFGSFLGGASSITVWSVPVFLPVTPVELVSAGASGTLSLQAQVTGVPGYHLTITDSSLFVYSNIDIDTGEIGSVSQAGVYLAGAVINSAPDDGSPQAFSPTRLLLGLVRQVRIGGQLRYVFIPEDDSVVVGGVRYIVSVIELEAVAEDPTALPYPPTAWPQTRFWQFANRHDPYLGVTYEGDTELTRSKRAAAEIGAIAQATVRAQEPMQLYLDTNRSAMTIWPIYAFPLATSTQAVDQSALKLLTSSILELLAAGSSTGPDTLVGEQFLLPPDLMQSNPFSDTAASTSAAGGASPIAIDVAAASELPGKPVTNLSPGVIPPSGTAAPTTLEVALTKSRAPIRDVVQQRTESNTAASEVTGRRRQPIYGFSVYSPRTREAYIVEVVGTRSGRPRPHSRPYDEQDLRPLLRPSRVRQHPDRVQHVDHRAFDSARSVPVPGPPGKAIHQRASQDRRA